MTDPQTPAIPPLTPEQAASYDKLRAWRRRVAMARAVAPFIIFSNKVLEEVARWGPTTLEELAALHGIGPAKLAAYGPAVLAALHAPISDLPTDDALVRLTAVLAAADLTPERRPGDDALVVRLPGGPAYAIVPVPDDWASAG
jgi:ribonuclease D